MSSSIDSSINKQVRNKLWLKIFHVWLMCLAGSTIYMIIKIRGIRGLDFAMYYLIGMCVCLIVFAVYFWPKSWKREADDFYRKQAEEHYSQVNQDPVYWETPQDRETDLRVKLHEALVKSNRKRL